MTNENRGAGLFERMHRKGSAGFSLIELMIVTAVVAILAGVAIPQYGAYARRGHRADARAVILDVAQLEERYFSTNNAYLAIAAPPAAPPGQWRNWSGSSSSSRKFDIVVAVTASPAAYTITATPSNGHADAECGTLTITSANVRTASGTLGNAECWRR